MKLGHPWYPLIKMCWVGSWVPIRPLFGSSWITCILILFGCVLCMNDWQCALTKDHRSTVVVYACLCQTRIKLPQKIKTLADFINSRDCPPKKWWLGLWKGLPYELNLGVCISWSINPWKKQVFQLWGGGSACWDEESRSAPAGRCTEETRDLATGGKDVSSISIKQSITIQSNPGIVIKWPNKCHQFLASSGMEQQLDDLTIL